MQASGTGWGASWTRVNCPRNVRLREIFEEAGLRVRNPQLKGILTFPEFTKGEDWYVFVYVVKEFEGELIDSPEGDLRWMLMPT